MWVMGLGWPIKPTFYAPNYPIGLNFVSATWITISPPPLAFLLPRRPSAFDCRDLRPNYGTLLIREENWAVRDFLINTRQQLTYVRAEGTSCTMAGFLLLISSIRGLRIYSGRLRGEGGEGDYRRNFGGKKGRDIEVELVELCGFREVMALVEYFLTGFKYLYG